MSGEFCEGCTAASTAESIGSYKEGLFGKELLGESQYCSRCNSSVRVFWQMVLYCPFKVLGCYRYKMTDMKFTGSLVTSFISRRVPDDKNLIRKTRIRGFIIAGVILAVAIGLIYLTNK